MSNREKSNFSVNHDNPNFSEKKSNFDEKSNFGGGINFRFADIKYFF